GYIICRDYIKHYRILTALYSFGLCTQVIDGKTLACGPSAVFAPRAVSTGTIRIQIALTAHNITALPHAARDDAQIAISGSNCAFAGYPQLFAEMFFLFDVIV